MPTALQSLDGFAATGVPTRGRLSRELLTLVPKLTPPAAETSDTTGSSLVDRLQARAEKLVRFQRTDATGTDRGAIVARVTAAALRNDANEARRELKTLAAGRSRGGPILDRQGRCARRRAYRIAPVCGGRHDGAAPSQRHKVFDDPDHSVPVVDRSSRAGARHGLPISPARS